MKEIQERLLTMYDNIINEFEQIEEGHRDFLEEAKNGNIQLDIMNERMALAKDNHRRLQNAREERESISKYNFL
tara:strand:+ start:15167 stop:15388 length:222 start_codon:yes stop_codon:yes gene_type:complete